MRRNITSATVALWTEEVGERLDTCAGIVEHVVLAGRITYLTWHAKLEKIGFRLRGLAAAAREPVGGAEAYLQDVRVALEMLADATRVCVRFRCAEPESLEDLEVVCEEIDTIVAETRELTSALGERVQAVGGAA